MATIPLVPTNLEFERALALKGIARTLLAIRIVCCLLVVVWLAMRPGLDVTTAATAAFAGWLLLLLLRWDDSGVWVTSHPAVLALDMIGSCALLAGAGPISPAILVLGSGVLLVGLCLGYRGCLWFSGIVVAGWWLAYVVHAADYELRTSAGLFVALALIPLCLLGALWAGAGIRSAALDAAHAERELRAQVRVSGVAEERARLAREMHDSLTKSLHGIWMMSEALPRWIEVDSQRAAQQARQISELLRQTVHESREMILAMRRAPAGSSVEEIVRTTVERWQRTTGRGASVEVTGEPDLPTESAYELSAILNEALENVHRHTPPGTTTDVVLEEAHSWVHLSVSDDGGGSAVSGPTDRPGHFGLVGMKERAARVGGELSVSDRPGQGITIVARLPATVIDEDDEIVPLTSEESIR